MTAATKDKLDIAALMRGIGAAAKDAAAQLATGRRRQGTPR